MSFKMKELAQELQRVGADPMSYSIGLYGDDQDCIMARPDGQWETFLGSRGQKDELLVWNDEETACFFLLGRIAYGEWDRTLRAAKTT